MQQPSTDSRRLKRPNIKIELKKNKRTSSVTGRFPSAADGLRDQHVRQHRIRAEPRGGERKPSSPSRYVSGYLVYAVLGVRFLNECLKTSSVNSPNVLLLLKLLFVLVALGCLVNGSEVL